MPQLQTKSMDPIYQRSGGIAIFLLDRTEWAAKESQEPADSRKQPVNACIQINQINQINQLIKSNVSVHKVLMAVKLNSPLGLFSVPSFKRYEI
jgi:hypothetical protein